MAAVRVVFVAALALACDVQVLGTGAVEGRFRVVECRPSGDFPLQDYRWTAGRVSSARFNDTYQILLQEHAVDLEQSDGLVVRIPDVAPLRADGTRPLRVPVGRGGGLANVTLSLFQTCPDRPQLDAASGEIVFEVFRLAARAEDAGRDEALSGTVTATVVGADGRTVAGTIRATFDFEPGARTLSTPL